MARGSDYSEHQLTTAMWIGMTLGAHAAMSPEEREEFAAWERERVDGSGRYASSDWPGYRRYVPPRPEVPERPAPAVKKPISRSLRRQVFEADAYRCQHCGTHLNLTCDHIVPESEGGATDFDNLQTLCQSCNSRKGTS